MSNYPNGNDLYVSLQQLEGSTNDTLAKSRAALQPKLEGQGKQLSQNVSFTSLVSDINKLTTVDRHITSVNLDEIRFKDSELFVNSAIPSNVLMLSETRIVYIEDGLLYLLDFDTTTLQITKKEVHKIFPLWNMSTKCSLFKLYMGKDRIWIVPKYTDEILCIYGNGLFTAGSLMYKMVSLPMNMDVIDFKDHNGTLTLISNCRAYFRLNGFTVDLDVTTAHWKTYFTEFSISTLCDGEPNYVGTINGEIFRFIPATEKFEYVIDLHNQRNYQDHYESMQAIPAIYKPIIAFSKNANRWTVVEKSNRILTVMPWDSSIEITEDFEELELPVSMTMASIASNTLGPTERTIIYGFDSQLKSVAYSFRSIFTEVSEIKYGIDTIPEYASIAIYQNRAVMLNLYEFKYLASDLFTAQEITDNHLSDFAYSVTSMRVAAYSEYQYNFGTEFNPSFIPEKMVYGNSVAIAIGKSGSSKDFNIAISTDTDHWDIVNIDPAIAINIQDIVYGNGYFVACGLGNNGILVSMDGFVWRKIPLSGIYDLLYITYNDVLKKFFSMTYTMTKLISIDPLTNEILEKSFTLPGVNSIKSLCSIKQNISIVYSSNGVLKSLVSSGGEVNPNLLGSVFVEKSSDFIMASYNIDGRCYTRETDDGINSICDLYKKTDIGHMVDNYGASDISNINNLSPEIIKYLNIALINANSKRDYINFAGDKGNLNIKYLPAEFKLASVNAGHLCVIGERLYATQPIRSKFNNISYIMNTDAYQVMAEPEDICPEKRLFMMYGDNVSDYYNPQSISYSEKNDHIEHFSMKFANLITSSDAGSIAYGNDIFVRVNPGDKCYYSKDAINWNGITMPAIGSWNDIVYGNGMFVAVRYINNTTSEVYYSSDAITWTKANIPALPYGWTNIEFSGTFFAVCAKNSSPSQYVILSADGKEWKGVSFTNEINKIKKVYSSSYPNSLIVFSTTSGIDDAYILTSPNTSLLKSLAGIPYHYDISIQSNRELYLDNAGNITIINEKGTATKNIDSVDTLEFYQLGNSIECSILYTSKSSNKILINLSSDKALTLDNIIELDIPDGTLTASAHAVVCTDDKIVIASRQPISINIDNTLPEVVEGSFYVAANDSYNQSLPFEADHVFLFNADSLIGSGKFLFGEIHNAPELIIDGGEFNSVTFFDVRDQTVGYRSDNKNRIFKTGFVFKNSSNIDRYVNYIAIKENKYK